jgi:hypothetical protein
MGRALGHDEQRGCTIESIGVRTRAGEANADERGRSTSRDPAHRAVPAQLEIAGAQCAPTGASHSICDAPFRLRVAARRPNACRATSLGGALFQTEIDIRLGELAVDRSQERRAHFFRFDRSALRLDSRGELLAEIKLVAAR